MQNAYRDVGALGAGAAFAPQLLAEALLHQRGGRAAAAALSYAALLQRFPEYPDELEALGAAAFAGGDTEAALVAFAALVALQPEVALRHHNLGTVCVAANKLGWAEACLARATEIDPASPTTWHNLGAVQLRLGNPGAAEAALRRAAQAAPHATDVQALLGVALLRLGQRAEAETCWHRAQALTEAGAADCSPTEHNSLGLLAAELGLFQPAEAHYRAALAHDPADGVVWANLAKLLRDAGRMDEAVEAADAALRCEPANPDHHCTRAHALSAAGRVAEAEASYAAALALDPAHADAHYHRGLLHLLDGRYQEGWDGFAWRWRRRGQAGARFPQPEWDGTSTAAPLLLHAEQGCGDTIQMARFIPALAAQRPTVLLVQPELRRLLSGLRNGVQVVSDPANLPPFACHASLMSLPGLLGTLPSTIPAAPYLAADPAEIRQWQGRLARLPGLRVGLAWAGNPAYQADNRRSIPPEQLGVLAGVPGVEFVSLQVSGPRPPFPTHDWTPELADFAATAALIAGLDLVVSVDTAVAHLAGALGRPVWLLNRFDPCWRWGLRGRGSTWYGSLQQFRQPAPGDWGSVLAAIRTELASLAALRACA